MRRVIVGDLLLSLVMPRKRAAATAGDLLETSRGSAQFWWSLLGTALRVSIAQLSIVSAVVAIGLSTLLNQALAFLFTAFLVEVNPPLFLGMPDIGFFLLTPMLSGYIMARCLPSREIAGMVAVSLFVSAAWTDG